MKRTKAIRRFLTALLIASLLMSACAPAAFASVKAKVFVTTKAYSGPSTSARSIKIPKGLTVSVTATSGGWARISYKGHSAYMPIPYLNLAKRLKAYTCKSTAVYKQPSSSSGKLGTLSIGTVVYVVNKVNGYYRIQNSSGSATGYVKAGSLTSKAKLTAAYNAYKKAKAAKAAAAAASSKKAASAKPSDGIVAYAKSFCGRPYKNDANPPSSFNCSTFVRYVMGKYGISMKDTAAKQATDSRYRRVGYSDMQVGDIVCIDGSSNGTCDHTGIYIGGGKMVDASQSAKKVQVTTLNDWYRSHFMWALRVK